MFIYIHINIIIVPSIMIIITPAHRLLNSSASDKMSTNRNHDNYLL